MNHVRTANPSYESAKILGSVLEQHQKHPVLLLLSGGSALLMLDHIDVSLLSGNLTITTLDERFSEDPQISNFKQIEATEFYASAIKNDAQTISTTIFSGETLEEAGERFEHALRAWKQNNPDGVIIATMGIGPDGHTAGLFPHQKGIDFSSTAWVCAYEVPPEVNQYAKRFSVAYTFLRTCVNEVIVYAVGEDKRAIVEKIQQPDCRLEDIPACIIGELQRVTVITD
jgi:6-phosphogluconolactonase/glucosamine-6-phosphate isomerase/deaminase